MYLRIGIYAQRERVRGYVYGIYIQEKYKGGAHYSLINVNSCWLYSGIDNRLCMHIYTADAVCILSMYTNIYRYRASGAFKAIKHRRALAISCITDRLCIYSEIRFIAAKAIYSIICID